MKITKIVMTDDLGNEALLFGNYTDANGELYAARVVRKWEYETHLNAGATSLTLQIPSSRIDDYLSQFNMQLNDENREQTITIYGNDYTSAEVPMFQGRIISYVENKPYGIVSCSSDGMSISQNKREYLQNTDAEGKLHILPLYEQVIKNSGKTDDGKKGIDLTVENTASFEGYFSFDEGYSNTLFWQAHGQLQSELIDHLTYATAGYQLEDGSYQTPVVYYPDRGNKSLIHIENYSYGTNLAVIELGHKNGLIRSRVEVNKPDKETVVNRVYFYRAIQATYDESGNLIDSGDPYHLIECYYEPDTIDKYGHRSVNLSYPEFIDTENGGAAALQMCGRGLCRFQNTPQSTISLTVDGTKLLDIVDEPLNNQFRVIDDQGKGDLGVYVCIGYKVHNNGTQWDLELAQWNPFGTEALADNLNLTEQRLSALETKTANLTNDLVMQIGSANLRNVIVDCHKDWQGWNFSGLGDQIPYFNTDENGNAVAVKNLGNSNRRWAVGYIEEVRLTRDITRDDQATSKKYVDDALQRCFPVGCIFMSTLATNPRAQLGFGTWVQYAQGRTIIGVGSSDQIFAAGTTGGESTHQLTINEMPKHDHNDTNSAGSHSHSGSSGSEGSHSHTIGSGGSHSHDYTKPSATSPGGWGSGGGYDSTTSGTTDSAGTHSHSCGSAGSHSHSINVSSSGSHYHTIPDQGGDAAHNNLPPYVVTYIWTRTA